jgi:hypothetical protein
LNNSPIYDDSQKYAQNAMREFAGLSIPEHVRGLIEAQIKLAYIAARGDVYRELRAVLSQKRLPWIPSICPSTDTGSGEVAASSA